MPKAVIMAGGTGGHIFPALAVAHALKQQGWSIQWLGTKDRMEANLVPKYGYPIHFLPVSGLRGKGLLAKVKSLLGLVKSIFSAIACVRSHHANVVLGFGGYPSVPGGLAAKLLRRPLLIHEQNAVAGLSNKLLGRIASRIFLGFPAAASGFKRDESDIEFVGNPVRQEIQAPVRSDDKLIDVNERRFNLLILGGSLGAKPLNEQLPVLLAQLTNKAAINIVHQCGKGNSESVSTYYRELAIHANVSDFIDDMAGAYLWADAVICRAGALTVSEVAAAGVAACFIPLPHAVDDHQTKNAMYLAKSDAAVVVDQADMTDDLVKLIDNWVSHPETCKAMGQRAMHCFPNRATEAIVAACQQYLKEDTCQPK